MYKLIAIILLLFISTASMGATEDEQAQWMEAAQKINLSEPHSLCKKSVNVVINQDVKLFRTIFAEIPATDEQVKMHLADLHDKYYNKSYLGIDNYRINEGREFAFEDAKNANNNLVRQSAQMRGHDLEVWVGYRFDTVSPKTNKPRQASGYCKLAYLQNQWKIISLL